MGYLCSIGIPSLTAVVDGGFSELFTWRIKKGNTSAHDCMA